MIIYDHLWSFYGHCMEYGELMIIYGHFMEKMVRK